MIRVVPRTAVASALAFAVLVSVRASGGAIPAHAAVAASSSTVEASFSPERAGARTASVLTLHVSGGAEGIPSPLRAVNVRAPAGLAGPSMEWPTTAGCSRRTLLRRGARGCPARSQIGSGSALIAWREGGRTVTEHARLSEFVGPTDGPYVFEILGEGTRPIRRRIVTTVGLAAVSGEYSALLEAAIPPIPTRPGGPDASIVSLSLTTGNAKRPRFSGRGVWGGMGFFVPSPCPVGGYPWAAEVVYADGSTQQLTTTVPCP